MPELKTYSVLIRWNDRDDEEGSYGATVRAPNPDEAEAMTRAMMRATGEGSPILIESDNGGFVLMPMRV